MVAELVLIFLTLLVICYMLYAFIKRRYWALVAVNVLYLAATMNVLFTYIGQMIEG